MKVSRPVAYDTFVTIVLPNMGNKSYILREWAKFTLHLYINKYISKREYNEWKTPHP